jgi:hypothetical protein
MDDRQPFLFDLPDVAAQVADATAAWPFCNAGCLLSARPCRVPCSAIVEIDRRALLAYHRERIVWALRRKAPD